MRTFNLYLSTLITSPALNYVVPLNKSNLANTTWNIDFENLFRGWNKKYKRCTVRFSLQSISWTASASDWENYSGYLSCNLPSVAGSTTNNGTFLGFIYPIDCPTTGTTTHCIQVSTLGNQAGIDIMMPSGIQNVVFQFYNDDALTLLTTVPDYQLQLLFELSEPIDEKLV